MKIIHAALLSIAVLAFAGCGAKSDALPATQETPKFESAVANDFVKSYSDVAKELADAYKAKDYAKAAGLAPKMAEVTGKSADAIKSLQAPDAQKLQDWITKVSQQLADAQQKR